VDCAACCRRDRGRRNRSRAIGWRPCGHRQARVEWAVGVADAGADVLPVWGGADADTSRLAVQRADAGADVDVLSDSVRADARPDSGAVADRSRADPGADIFWSPVRRAG
jgi:hypothetical protein